MQLRFDRTCLLGLQDMTGGVSHIHTVGMSLQTCASLDIHRLCNAFKHQGLSRAQQNSHLAHLLYAAVRAMR